MNFTCSLSKICPILHSALQHRWLIICALKSEHLNIYRNFNHLRLKWKDENFSVGLTADLLPDWWVLGFKPGTCKKPVHRVGVTHVSGYGTGSHRNQYTADAAFRFQHLLVIIICSLRQWGRPGSEPAPKDMSSLLWPQRRVRRADRTGAHAHSWRLQLEFSGQESQRESEPNHQFHPGSLCVQEDYAAHQRVLAVWTVSCSPAVYSCTLLSVTDARPPPASQTVDPPVWVSFSGSGTGHRPRDVMSDSCGEWLCWLLAFLCFLLVHYG